MKFNVVNPCSHCPFRKDINGYLHPDRARDLAQKLESDDMSWFACHETTTGKHRSTRHPLAAQCAGQMILMEKVGRTSVAMRIAYAVGILKREELNLKAPVFDTFEEFVKHPGGEYAGVLSPDPRRSKGRHPKRRKR